MMNEQEKTKYWLVILTILWIILATWVILLNDDLEILKQDVEQFEQDFRIYESSNTYVKNCVLGGYPSQDVSLREQIRQCEDLYEYIMVFENHAPEIQELKVKVTSDVLHTYTIYDKDGNIISSEIIGGDV